MVFSRLKKDSGMAGGVVLLYSFSKKGEEIFLINKIVRVRDRRQQKTKSGGCTRENCI